MSTVGGLLHLPEASRRFLDVKTVAADRDAALLRVPAKVEFEDGAVAGLGAPFAGKVVSLHAQTGAHVSAGDPLITLECPDASAARSALIAANADLTEAKASAQRAAKMLADGVGTDREKLEADAHLAERQAEVERAAAAVGFAGAGSGGSVVLRAPIAGTVIERKTTVGASVQPGGEPLISVGDPSAIWIVAQVFERDLPLVKEGARASIELASAQEPLEGRVSSIGSVIAGGSRTAPVRIEIAGPRVGSLKPGMFGRARIQAAQSAISLPTEAVLIREGKETVVFVEKEPLAYERRPIIVAQPIEGRVQVVSGLAPGERVVVSGAVLLDGALDQLL